MHRGCTLFIVLTLWGFTAATVLNCFTGHNICDEWLENDQGSSMTFNGVVYCCPPEPNQGIKYNNGDCKCQAGSAEKYNRDGSVRSGASGLAFGPWPFALVLMASAGAHLLL